MCRYRVVITQKTPRGHEETQLAGRLLQTTDNSVFPHILPVVNKEEDAMNVSKDK